MKITVILLIIAVTFIINTKAQGVLGIPINQPAIDFTQNDINGNPISLETFKGKYILLDFWASWCEPCRRENPNLVEVYKKYHEKGFEIVGISLDEDKEAWANAIKKDNLTWPQLSDLKGEANEVAKLYNVTALPYNYLIDAKGMLVARLLKKERLQNKLKEIFDTENKTINGNKH